MQPSPSWACSSSVVRMNIFLLAMASVATVASVASVEQVPVDLCVSV